ncbi:bifunctional ADP-dependent NAD(P)H-hydrate dehydratase/NAD(P)H-hydrate epimerase [Deinococcus frigens]|uniref:bifunctional ADP-dependent NAD(P)H-hydrate dehydratase/NAD(P)H-hydrate epimerase n=1 Tax=Deinococcus frigens TaxID=249403 RepID=UPI00049862F1|nr:bifunctional ADP-dependent NAD(P)H-hydrate dehydratase/NAD(P)H-hydrate epimerase [Deinococcus frigens]
MSEFILSPGGARRVDARLERAGLLDLTMEEAGRAVADAVQTSCLDGPVLLLAGGGANGGDALVAARHLLTLGRGVQVLAQPSKHPLTRLNRRRLRAVGGEVRPLNPASLRRAAASAGVVVDGLLGTGFVPPLRPALAEVIEALNTAHDAGMPVVSIDLPSGLDASCAEVAGPSVRADLTVTLMGLKTALLFGEAATCSGRVMLPPLRVPPDWVRREALGTRPDDSAVAALLPVRTAGAHKGTAGRVWIVGGHPGTVGAAALAGLGALRAGAGLVTVHSLADVPLVTPELMVRQHATWDSALPKLRDSGLPDAVALGMGLGPEAVRVAREVLAWGVPTVLDADALHPELAGHGHPQCVWTPHPGEAARLLGVRTPQVTRDPLTAARRLQELLGGTVVLKGGPSVVASADALSVSRGGHPGMASAGMGDTLSGLLAALLGQGLSAGGAAVAGVRLHARAGELAAATHGYGLIATDVSSELGAAWLDLTRS